MGDSTILAPGRHPVASSLRFAQVTPRQTVTSRLTSVKLDPTPLTPEENTEKGNSDIAIMNLGPRLVFIALASESLLRDRDLSQ
jgi:hypothetical protein